MTLRMKPIVSICLGIAALLFNLSCSASSDSLRVLAASSLTEAFEEIANEFENKTGNKVTLSFAGSSSLAVQIEDGAPVDVVALADEETFERVKQSGRLTQHDETIFATNYLAIITPIGNPASIMEISDFDGNKVALCQEQVPCGRLTKEITSSLPIEIQPATWEPNVRSVRTKVELGEVDAGIVYVTDVTSRVEAIPIRESENIRTRYPIAIVDNAKPSAMEFVDFVLSTTGQGILNRFGFGKAQQ